jgi:hypothetical protein
MTLIPRIHFPTNHEEPSKLSGNTATETERNVPAAAASNHSGSKLPGRWCVCLLWDVSTPRKKPVSIC